MCVCVCVNYLFNTFSSPLHLSHHLRPSVLFFPSHLFISYLLYTPPSRSVCPLEDQTGSSDFEASWLIVFLSPHQGLSDRAAHHRSKLTEHPSSLGDQLPPPPSCCKAPRMPLLSTALQTNAGPKLLGSSGATSETEKILRDGENDGEREREKKGESGRSYI